ncbi:MAG TPA: hypothetical protein VMC06_08675 [Opitutaceae bacterium]|nr:hypothetical protein [Opitutaceae bacterium]
MNVVPLMRAQAFPKQADHRRRARGWPRWAVLAVAAACLTAFQTRAVTLAQLQHDPRLTPKRFANYFADFGYELSLPVQPAEVFLAREKGDCDDYAVLADFVLKPKGYATRLIHVRLVGRIPHAVCYVAQAKAYLDYNNRDVFFTLARSGPTLREIATRVASSFDANWTSATEFTYSYVTEAKSWGATVVKTDPPKNDPALGATHFSKIYVN